MARVVITGGAGFVGSHLCDALIARGDQVVALDSLITGTRDNLAHLEGEPGFEFVECDVSVEMPVTGPVDRVMHFASPASPFEYLAHPFETLDAGSLGTRRALDLALEHGARFLLASTSEIYGEPQEHPQRETYWGNVNSIGPRAVYDEAKRFAETLTMTYHRELGVDIGIVRIFNTYGPRLRAADGRVVSNFLVQAMDGRPLTVYGDGSQTRAYCYVDDEVRGILALLDSGLVGPVNIGNPAEFTVAQLAQFVLEVTGSDSELVFEPLPTDDPTRRCPDIT
ncbi:MAG TPA: NAD-dependent epimerase/dehydratase family protein, partial [Acidimicrobiia bacterium]